MMKPLAVKHKTKGAMFALLLGILTLSGSAHALEPASEKQGIEKPDNKAPYSPYVGRTYATDVCWGDTHLHTSYSVDAGLAGNRRLGPEDAYRFARGEKIVSNSGMPVRLSRPLDFLVVADHAEYLGLAPKILASDPQVLATGYGKRWHDMLKGGPEQAFAPIFEAVMSMMQRDENIKDPGLRQSAWEYITKTADKHNDPGKFTALIGFEWTSMPGPGNNLHRVVIFKDGRKAGRDGKIKPVGDSVDIKNASYTNTIGDAELRSVWTDPELDSGERACYYARVIEIPTPRWTAYDAKYFGLEMPEEVPMTTQERAYTSPIWYTPDAK